MIFTLFLGICSQKFFTTFCENSRLVVVSTVSSISAALGVAVVACVIADPGVPMLLYLVFLLTLLYNEAYIGHRTIGLKLLDNRFFLLSNYRTIEYRTGKFEKLSDYGISDQGHNLSDYQISDSQKTIGCPPLLVGTGVLL